MRIIILNGPNLNMLGEREPAIYGTKTYNDLKKVIIDEAKKQRVSVIIKQSNHEGKLIDWIQRYRNRVQGIIINPGALTHYSYALYDCLKGISVPVVEVHLSDIKKREGFRQLSVIEPACIKQLSGLGFNGYIEAINVLLERNHSS